MKVKSAMAGLTVPQFQKHAFDPSLSRKQGVAELRKVIDGDELGSPDRGTGFQPKKLRRIERPVPEWARTDAGLQRVLLTAFPRLKRDPRDRARAGRWAQVINLYFRQNLSRSEIAAELSLTYGAVDSLIRNIKRAASGIRADGSGERVPRLKAAA
jgi:hypothetical protein